MKSKLSVNLVTWNGSKYIPYLFDSMHKQTFLDWKLYILDNHSQDNTVDLIKKELNNFSIQCKLIEIDDNLGFANGHNKLFKEVDSEYFLVLNQDIYLEPDCLGKLVKFMDEKITTATVTPRLMKWNLEVFKPESSSQLQLEFADHISGFDADLLKKSFSNKIDSLGLKVAKNRRVVEISAGEIWNRNLQAGNAYMRSTQGLDSTEIFGVSGTCSICRKNMIEEVLYSNNNIFDENYHNYKEDVDLAYRLQTCGFKSRILFDAVAYHDRSGSEADKAGDWSAIKNKAKQSDWIKYNSYKNHLATLYKNEYLQNFIFDLPWILWYELRKFAYFLFFDRGVLKGLLDLWKGRKHLKLKRENIKKIRSINWKEMRSWWC